MWSMDPYVTKYHAMIYVTCAKLLAKDVKHKKNEESVVKERSIMG